MAESLVQIESDWTQKMNRHSRAGHSDGTSAAERNCACFRTRVRARRHVRCPHTGTLPLNPRRRRESDARLTRARDNRNIFIRV